MNRTAFALSAVLAASVACAEAPRPNARILRHLKAGVDVIGIVHFSVNTFTDREWGYGSEDPRVFAPTAFDAEQIVGACAAGGVRGLVVVAKHHDGFCLWPTKTTGHNVAKSPFRGGKGDYVKEMERACRKFGVAFGVYCSPWDRNAADYARPGYVETYHRQVKELTDGTYGEIFELWFDGANGGDGYYGGAWERRSIAAGYYRFPELLREVRVRQPDMVVFGPHGELAWPGNERGVVPPESGATRGNVFVPYEADFPLRPGWFYHESQDGHSRSGEFLMKVYLRTVGNAAVMDIGIAPDRRGLLTDEDARCLARFGELRRAFFANEVGSCATPFNLVQLEEDVADGERVDEWRLTLGGKEIARGGKIGCKRIRTLDAPLHGENLKLEVVRGTARPEDVKVRLFSVDPGLVRRVREAEEPQRSPAPFELRGVMTKREPTSLTFMVKHPRIVRALALTPDPQALDGTPVAFTLSCSADGEKWTDVPGEFRLDNVAANPIAQMVTLPQSVCVKYVRLDVRRTLKEGAPAALKGLDLVPAAK